MQEFTFTQQGEGSLAKFQLRLYILYKRFGAPDAAEVVSLQVLVKLIFTFGLWTVASRAKSHTYLKDPSTVAMLLLSIPG